MVFYKPETGFGSIFYRDRKDGKSDFSAFHRRIVYNTVTDMTAAFCLAPGQMDTENQVLVGLAYL